MRKPQLLCSAAVLASLLTLAGCSDSPETSNQVEAPPPPAAPAAPAAEAPGAQTPVAQALEVEVFRAGDEALFGVSSVIVSGKEEAVLIDAQFSSADARQLAERVQASGKRLTTIYISHSEPEYYFGLDTLRNEFPDARIVATAQTVETIEATKDSQLEVWGPQLAENAPADLVVPEVLEGDTLMLEGQELKVFGLDGPTPDRTVVWIPSIRTVAGGIPVVSGEHVWIADTPSTVSRQHWLAMLAQIIALEPDVVVPGRMAPGSEEGVEAVEFTANYLRTFEEEAGRAENADELIAAMKERYPDLGGEETLETSARVVKGEMERP